MSEQDAHLIGLLVRLMGRPVNDASVLRSTGLTATRTLLDKTAACWSGRALSAY